MQTMPEPSHIHLLLLAFVLQSTKAVLSTTTVLNFHATKTAEVIKPTKPKPFPRGPLQKKKKKKNADSCSRL